MGSIWGVGRIWMKVLLGRVRNVVVRFMVIVVGKGLRRDW